MLEPADLSHAPSDSGRRPGLAIAFTHPDDVLQSPDLSRAEKRAILASWASDAHAVPNLPAVRQLESGATVAIDAILAALQALDAQDATRATTRRGPDAKRSLATFSRWCRPLRRRSRHDDDDDDPSPCPAAALPPEVELELRRRRDEAWQLLAA